VSLAKMLSGANTFRISDHQLAALTQPQNVITPHALGMAKITIRQPQVYLHSTRSASGAH
jgi:hypothetical protein